MAAWFLSSRFPGFWESDFYLDVLVEGRLI